MLDKNKRKKQSQRRRHLRARAKISGTTIKPRLSVFRSLNHIYVQAIDDINGETLAAASDLKLDVKKVKTELKGKQAKAYGVGLAIAKELLDKKIEEVVFDKSGLKYHGRVKALAEGAREGGLKF